MDYLLWSIGVAFIVTACNIGREKESKIKQFSTDYWIQMFLIVIGLYLANFVYKN